jgi:hypothetical protein
MKLIQCGGLLLAAGLVLSWLYPFCSQGAGVMSDVLSGALATMIIASGAGGIPLVVAGVVCNLCLLLGRRKGKEV